MVAYFFNSVSEIGNKPSVIYGYISHFIPLRFYHFFFMRSFETSAAARRHGKYVLIFVRFWSVFQIKAFKEQFPWWLSINSGNITRGRVLVC